MVAALAAAPLTPTLSHGGEGGFSCWGVAFRGLHPRLHKVAAARLEEQKASVAIRRMGNQSSVMRPQHRGLGAGALKRAAVHRRFSPFPGLCFANPSHPSEIDSDQICQSSMDNPGTRLNSPMLCVTTVKPLTSAMAAICMSCGPIFVPSFSNRARSSP